MAAFEFLRLSLIKANQLSLLGSDAKPAREISRREYLDRVFANETLDFIYHGTTYTFLKDGVYGDTLVGRIGKKKIESIHRGPDQGYAVELVEGWKPIWCLLDLSSDSQLICVQTGLASSRNLLRALFNAIERRLPGQEYESYIEYISDGREFWHAVDKYRGRLTRLEFTFVPPNAIGLEEKIRTIVDAGKEIGSETTKFTHVNPSGGLHPEGEYVEAALAKTSEGAGSVLLKAGQETVYSSSKNRRTITISKDELPAQKDDTAITRLISRLFGK